MPINPLLVEDVRSASRTMVRELGFMRATLAGTAHSASAVHALLEIEGHAAMTAVQLVQALGLDKSSVSRMVGKLIRSGELAETAGGEDGRTKRLSLTPQGQRTVGEIHAFGRRQVATAMSHLSPSQRQAVRQGLSAYASALQACRADTAHALPQRIAIRCGYQPGVVGRVAEMHAAFYARHAGFGQFFESKVATGVAEFVGRLDQACNRIWVATDADRIVGAIAIDGQDLPGNEAHLRWFILDEGYRGSGMGHQLLSAAVAFCDEYGFAATRLWTFQGLNAARRLYESAGFQLSHEAQGSQWGTTVTEQQFTRRPPPSA